MTNASSHETAPKRGGRQPGPLMRKLMYLRYNLVDFWDSRVAPPLAPVRTPLGFQLQGLRSQHHRAMQEGRFEPTEVALLEALLPTVDRFVDVGANVGYFTLLARARNRPVVAVEPLPGNLRHLLANLVINKWADTEVQPVGLSSRIGIADLHGASSTGASLLSNWAGAPASIRTRIALSTLDTIIGERFQDERLLIKIDVEGLEYQVLQGATHLLSRTVEPIWLVEVALAEYHPEGRNPDYLATFETFMKRGYSCFLVLERTLQEVSMDAVVRWNSVGATDTAAINYLFVPKGATAALGAIAAMRPDLVAKR
jgi:FkbM family methyltransferase